MRADALVLIVFIVFLVLDATKNPGLAASGYRSVKQTITKHLKSYAASQLAIKPIFHSS